MRIQEKQKALFFVKGGVRFRTNFMQVSILRIIGV